MAHFVDKSFWGDSALMAKIILVRNETREVNVVKVENDRSNSRLKPSLEVLYKKGIFEIFVKFTGKHLCWSLFFSKLLGYQNTYTPYLSVFSPNAGKCGPE